MAAIKSAPRAFLVIYYPTPLELPAFPIGILTKGAKEVFFDSLY